MTFPDECQFTYERQGVVLHIQTHGLTNHELRNILIGWWLALNVDDRADHIAELTAYMDPRETPPGMSTQIAAAVVQARDHNN